MANFKEEVLLLKIVADISKAGKDIAGLADTLDKPVSSIAEMQEQVKSLTKALKTLPQEGTKGFDELSRALGAVKFIDSDEAAKELTQLFDTLNRKLGESEAKLKQFNNELGRPGVADANIRVLADSFEDIKGVLDRTPQSVKEVEDRLKILQTYLKRIPAEGSEAFDQLSFEIANLASGNGNLDDAADGITNLRATIVKEVIASNDALKDFRASMKAPIEVPEGSLNDLRQQLIALRKEFDNLSAADRDGDFGQQLLVRIQGLDTEVKSLEESTGRAQRNVGAYGKAVKEALDEYRTIPQIQADIKELTNEQQRLTEVGNKIAKALRQGGAEAEKFAELLRQNGRTGKDAQDILQKELVETQNQLKTLVQQTERSNRQLISLQNDFRSATASAGRLVKGALIAIGADLSFQALKNAIGSTITSFSEFEDRVATLAGVLGKPIARIKELRQNAEALGAATSFSATQVAELQTEFARIGFNEEQILNATGATLALAQATGETLANSAAVAGATLQGFGLDASETQRVTDVMAKSFNNTALDLDGFRESMKRVAPIAKAANITLEESTAILGQLSNAGIKGELAGTSVKNILAGIGDESSGLSKFLGRTVNTFDELVDAFDDASKRGDNFARATKFLGEQVRPAVLALLDNANALRTLRGEYENAAGAAQRTADIQSQTLTFAIEEFKGSLEGLQIAVGTRLAPTFKDIVSLGTSFVNILQGIVSTPISESIENEQVALNGLVQSLFDAEEGTERYKSLLEELETLYPELIDNIDKEEAGLQTLLKSLTQAGSSEADRLNAITQLSRQYPDFIKQITDENKELADLIPRLTDSNTSAYDKKVLLEELKKEYPDFLAFINENTSFETQLKNALNATNAEYVNRIILQKQRESLEKELEKVAERQVKRYELERALEQQLFRSKQALVAVNQQYATSIDLTTGSLEDRSKAVLDAIEQAKKEKAAAGDLSIFDDLGAGDIINLNFRLGQSLDKVTSAQAKANEEQKEFDGLLKQLGLSTGNSKDAIEALTKQIRELQQEQAGTLDPIRFNIIGDQIKNLNDKIIDLGGQSLLAGKQTGKKVMDGIVEGIKKEKDKALPGTIRFMREALQELRKQIDNTPDLQKRVELIEKASEIEKKINDAENLVKAFEARNQDRAIQLKIAEKDKLEQQIKSLNEELDKAAKDRRLKIDGEIDDVMNKLFNLQQEIKDTFGGPTGSIELKPKFEEYKTIKAQLDDLKDRAENLTTPREVEIKADIERTKASIDDLNRRANTFSDLSEFKVTPDFQQLGVLEKSLERLNQELETAGQQAKIDLQLQTQQAEERLAVLSGELLSLTGKDITPKLKEVERLKAQLADLKNQLDSDVPQERELVIKASIGAAEQLLSKLDSEIEALRSKEVKLPILTNELIAAQKEVDRLQAKLNAASAAEKNRIQIDITAAQAKVEQLQDQIIALAEEEVTVEVDIIGLSESDVSKLFETLVSGKKGIEEAIGIGAKAALETQLSAIAQSEQATLQSLNAITDASEEAFAARAALETRLADIRVEQQRTALRFAVASEKEGTQERQSAILALLEFELKQTVANAEAKRSIGKQLTEQEFLERKNFITAQLADVEGVDEKSKKKREELERELTRVTIEEEIRRKKGAISGIDAQIEAQQKLLSDANASISVRTEAEAKIAELQTDRLKLQGEILDAEVNLTKTSVDKQLEEYKRLEDQRRELRDAGFQVLDALVSGFIQAEQAKLQTSLQQQQDLINKRYSEESRIAGDNAELKAQIDAKYQKQREAAERAAAKKRKEIAIKEAIVNTALAVIKALPNPIAAGAAALLGAIQIAVMEAQQFAMGGPLDMAMRMMAVGGNIPDKGMITGKRHSQGGVKTMYQGVPIEVEGGEGTTRNGKRRWIFNRRVMADPVLREFAMKTHSAVHNPVVDQLAWFINQLGLQRLPFAAGGSIGTPAMTYRITPPPRYYEAGGLLDVARSAGTGDVNSLLLQSILNALVGIAVNADDIAEASSNIEEGLRDYIRKNAALPSRQKAS